MVKLLSPAVLQVVEVVQAQRMKPGTYRGLVDAVMA